MNESKKRRPNVHDRMVRVGPLMGLPALVRELDCDSEPIFKQAGFDTSEFEDPEKKIPFLPASRLLASSVTATGCEHLGLLLGERVDPSSLGVAGFMLRAAPNVGTALRGLVLHLDLHDQGGDVVLSSDGKLTFFGYVIHILEAEATDHIYDLSIAVACKIMRSLCGVDWNPIEVLLSRREPPDPAPHQNFYRGPVRFDSDQNSIVFSTHWLHQPIPSADPFLYRHLEQEAIELHASQHTSLVIELRRMLRESLGSRKSAVTNIATQLHLHERTLNRRLREEGTSFRKELESVRCDIARQLLAEGDTPLSTIATSLDYADATAFIRAFKRWSGKSPAEWRRAYKRD